MKRGEIWVGLLDPRRGAEPGKSRPVLVMQANALTEAGADTVVVLPLTTKIWPGANVYRVDIHARERLLKNCQVMIDKPRALDRERFGAGPLARLNASELAKVEKSLKAVLNF